MKRRQHLDELAIKYGTPIFYIEHSPYNKRPDGKASGLCYPWGIELVNYKEEDQCSYFAGLHEFGHVVYKHNIYPNRGLIASYREYENEAEILAWGWAIKNSHEEPEQATIDDIYFCCYSYRLRDSEIERIFEKHEH